MVKYFWALLFFTIGFVNSGSLLALDESYYDAPKRNIGPQKKVPVQIIIQDPADNSGRIISASFDRKTIPLRAPSPSNVRGKLYAWMYPGNYEMRWALDQFSDSFSAQTYVKQIVITERDVWITITIQGSEIRVN